MRTNFVLQGPKIYHEPKYSRCNTLSPDFIFAGYMSYSLNSLQRAI